MPYIHISTYSGPPSTITVCDLATGLICYTYPTPVTDVDPFPIDIPLPSTFDLVGAISLSAQSVNGCLIVQTDVCSVLPTPTATLTPPCYFWLVTPTVGWTAGDTLTYTDCYGNPDTYTTQVGDATGFYICAQGLIDGTNLTWDYETPTLECTEIDGEWVGPVPPSMTPTPSNPPTPTPTPTSGASLIESFSFSAAGSNTSVWLESFNPSATFTVNWGDGTTSALTNANSYTLSKYYSGAYTAGTKVVTVSGVTTTPGVLTSVRAIKGLSGGGAVAAPQGYITVYYTPFSSNTVALLVSTSYSASTTELSKCVNAIEISDLGSWFGYITGDISDFSACTSLQTLKLGGGNFTGDINNLPNSISNLTLGLESYGVINSTGSWPKIVNDSILNRDINTVSGNIANLPTSLASVKITGDNTLTGDITGFANQSWGPTSNIQIRGNNSISGSFANLPNIPTIWIMNGKINNSLYNTAYITTGNTITGALTLQSNQNDIIIGGANTISGSLTGTTVYTGAAGRMSRLVIGGNNTINGTMSQLRTPNTFIIAGNNTISGDLSQMNNAATNQTFMIFQKGNTLTAATGVTIVNSGNTVTGNISNLSPMVTLKNLYLGGQNTVYGNLGVFSGLTDINQLIIASDANGINDCTLTNFNWLGQVPWVILTTNSGGLSVTAINNLISNCIVNLMPDGLRPFYTITGSGHAAPTGAALTTKNNYNAASSFGKITTN
jgi:hypothetical protein